MIINFRFCAINSALKYSSQIESFNNKEKNNAIEILNLFLNKSLEGFSNINRNNETNLSILFMEFALMDEKELINFIKETGKELNKVE